MNTKSISNSSEPVYEILGFVFLWIFLMYLTVVKIVGVEQINGFDRNSAVLFMIFLLSLLFVSMFLVSKLKLVFRRRGNK